MKYYVLNYVIIIFIGLLSINKAAQFPLSEDNECEKISSLLINHLITRNPLPEKYSDAYKLIKFSGTGLNDLGDYYACDKLPYAHYYTITISINQLTQSIGLCYLKECDKAYIEKALMNLYDYLSTTTTLPITKENIKVSFPKQALKDKTNSYLIGVCVIIFLLLIEVVLMLLGSLTKSKIFSPFNITKNAQAIFSVRNPNETYAHLRIFDGIRFFSAGWVVFGHSAYIPMMYGPRNILDMSYLATSWYTPFMTSAYFSVDVFFFMSGFLFYFSFQKLFNQSFPKIKLFFLSLLARYCRLLPFLIFGVFGATYLLPFLSDGPNYSKVDSFNMGCIKYWWHNFIYINNMVHYDGTSEKETMCMPHGWYLACDMQFFLYSIIVAIFFNNHKQVQHIIYACTFVFSIQWQYVQVYIKEYGFNDMIHINRSSGSYFSDFYIHPCARIGPYLLGIFFCELFLHTDLYVNDYEKEEEEKEKKEEIDSKEKEHQDNKDKVKEEKLEINFSNTTAKEITVSCDTSQKEISATNILKEEKLEINRVTISSFSNTSDKEKTVFCDTSQKDISATNIPKEKQTVSNNEDEDSQPFLPRTESLLYKINTYIKNSTNVSWAIFLFALLCINGSFWISSIGNKHLVSLFWSATLNTWSKIVFILGLGLVIHLTFLDKFNFIRHFLTLKIASAVSKTTYGIYVIHIYLVAVFVLAYNNFYYLRIYDLFLLAIGIFCVSWILALVIGLLIESPIIVICKIFIKGDGAMFDPKKKVIHPHALKQVKSKETKL